MRLNATEMPPERLRLVILVLGLGLAFFVYSGVEKKVDNLRYERVLGNESSASGLAEHRPSQSQLPIVVASGKQGVGKDLVVSDELIAGAFNPVVVVEDEEDEISEEEPEVRLIELLLQQYRPVVGAISSRGAVINGIHYSVGESLNNMPVFADGKLKVTPRLVSVSHAGAVIQIQDDRELLKFSY